MDRQACNNSAAYLFLPQVGSILTNYGFGAGRHPPRIKRGDSNTFHEQINALNDLIVQEWRERGNQAESFADSGIKIVIILDNASFHKKKDILSQISAEMPHII